LNHKYILAFDRDITERKRAGEAIQKYARALEESNRMKELFIEEAAKEGFDHDNLRKLVKLEAPAGRWSGGPLNIAKRALQKLKRDLFTF